MCEELLIPARTVAGVVTVVKEELLPLLNVPDRGDAGDQTVAGVLEEPLGTVVVEVVVDLVPESSPVVLGVDEVPGQVHPLPPDVLRVGEYLVPGVLPAFLPSMSRR